jgi:hypothetical protein
MSFFDRQGIPETLLRTQTEQDVERNQRRRNKDRDEDDDEDNVLQASMSHEFEDNIVALRNVHLCQRGQDNFRIAQAGAASHA